MLSLLPKLRDQFAEFLKYGSLKALSLLDLFTSVGLQYGDFLLTLFRVIEENFHGCFLDSFLSKKKNRHHKILPIKDCFHIFFRGRLTLRR